MRDPVVSTWSKILGACEDDTVVKFLFDNIRNMGIVGLVGAAAEWLLQGKSLYALAAGVALAVITAVLLFINLRHFASKLRSLAVPPWIRNALAVLYGTVFAGLLTFLAVHP
jgi:hypothetical protein